MDFYGDQYRWFVGVVKEVVDEAFVRVRIFGIHPIDESLLDSSDLPLALVSYPVTGAQNGSGNATHNLQVGSWVHGFSPDDTFMQPIITGVIQGTTYSESNYSSSSGEFVGQPGSNPSSDSTSTDTGTGTEGVDTGATTNIPGGSNVEKAYNYAYQKLKEEGSSPDPHLHASALVGCIQLECGPKLNYNIVNSIGAYGLCQWLGARKRRLLNTYGSKPSLANQLDFMWWELNHTHKSAKQKWLAGTNLPDAVAGFCWFEIAEEITGGKLHRNHKNYKNRLAYAYKIYNSMTHTDQPTENINNYRRDN